MADNLTTAASLSNVPVGSVIATKDTGGAQHQRIIAHRDRVRSAVTSSGLTTTATAYTAGDQVGTLFTIPNMARASGGSGTIIGVKIVSAAATIGPFDVQFFDSSVTLSGGDNGAHAISDADALKEAFTIPCGAVYLNANNRSAQAINVAAPYVCSGGTSLYAALITKSAIAATPFAAGTDITLIVYAEPD